MPIYKTSEVFVPGGMPILTYVPRIDIKLEERLNSAKENLCKLVTVTGATKFGKTVSVDRCTIAMPDEKPLDQQTIDNIFSAMNNIKGVISVKKL